MIENLGIQLYTLRNEMTDEEKNQKIEDYLNNANEDYSKGE